jgi:hypothetical protein
MCVNPQRALVSDWLVGTASSTCIMLGFGNRALGVCLPCLCMTVRWEYTRAGRLRDFLGCVCVVFLSNFDVRARAADVVVAPRRALYFLAGGFSSCFFDSLVNLQLVPELTKS